jgi:hypothetical protein
MRATNPIRLSFAMSLLCAGLLAHPQSARAAESYDNCTGFITTLPTTISTQGVWCLKQNLATNIANGSAITIAANNVTIDCNDFKIGGLAAGDGSQANGIYAMDQQNATIRHCGIRGFYLGINLAGGFGHLVEDNRLDNNLQTAIFVGSGAGPGGNVAIRRNRIFDTGGTTQPLDSVYGIYISYANNVQIDDNEISSVIASNESSTTGHYVFGIGAYGYSGYIFNIRRNSISGLQGDYVAPSGIVSNGFGMVSDNVVAAVQKASRSGISANGACHDNHSVQFTGGISCITDGGGNTSYTTP